MKFSSIFIFQHMLAAAPSSHGNLYAHPVSGLNGRSAFVGAPRSRRQRQQRATPLAIGVSFGHPRHDAARPPFVASNGGFTAPRSIVTRAYLSNGNTNEAESATAVTSSSTSSSASSTSSFSTRSSNYSTRSPISFAAPQPLSTSGDWSAYLDESKGLIYYFDRRTGESKWEPPAGVAFPEMNMSISQKVEMRQRLKRYLEERLNRSAGEFMEGLEEETMGGRKNNGNGGPDTSRVLMYEEEKNEELLFSQKQTASLRDIATSISNSYINTIGVVAEWNEWTARIDEKRGLIYYYNDDTKASVWDRPSGFPEFKLSASKKIILEAQNRRYREANGDGKKDATGSASSKVADASAVDSEPSSGIVSEIIGKDETVSDSSSVTMIQEFDNSNTNNNAQLNEEQEVIESSLLQDETKEEVIPPTPLVQQGDWAAYLDEESDLVYYFHAPTATSTWDPPFADFPAVVLEKTIPGAMGDYASSLAATTVVVPQANEDNLKDEKVEEVNSWIEVEELVQELPTIDEAVEPDVVKAENVILEEDIEVETEDVANFLAVEADQKLILEEEFEVNEDVANVPEVEAGLKVDNIAVLEEESDETNNELEMDLKTSQPLTLEEETVVIEPNAVLEEMEMASASDLEVELKASEIKIDEEIISKEESAPTAVLEEVAIDEVVDLGTSEPVLEEEVNVEGVLKEIELETDEEVISKEEIAPQAVLEEVKMDQVVDLGTSDELDVEEKNIPIAKLAEFALDDEASKETTVDAVIPQNDVISSNSVIQQEEVIGDEIIVDLESESVKASVENVVLDEVGGNEPRIPTEDPFAILTGRTLYDVLECSPTSTRTEIKKSYIKLAKETHPDALLQSGILNNVDAEQRFTEISQAYDILYDTTSRRRYDRELKAKGLSLTAGNLFGNWVKGVAKSMDEALTKAEKEL